MPGDLYYGVQVNAPGASYDLSDDLSSLVVDQCEGRPDALTVEIADPYKVLGHALQEGMEVVVDLGTDDDHAVVFRGRIYRVDGAFPTSQTPTLRLQAYDRSMRMGLKRRNRPFTGMTLSRIVQEVAGPYFRTVDVQVQGDPPFPGNGIRQHEETDLRFLRRLARAFGCLLYVAPGATDDTLRFVGQSYAMSQLPAVTVYHGRSDVSDRLLSFQSSVDAADIELPRVLSGVDYHTGQPIEREVTQVARAARSDDPFFSENLSDFASRSPDRAQQIRGLVTRAAAARAALRAELGASVREATPTFTTEDQQRAVAQNQFSTSVLGMRASGSTVGIRRITAQTSIAVGDVGGRFSGTWFLSQVRHILDEQGYRTEFECRR